MDERFDFRKAQLGGDYFGVVKIEPKSEIPILGEPKSFYISLLVGLRAVTVLYGFR